MSNKDVRSKYEQITSELFGNKHKLAEFLAFSGRFYKLPSAQAMAVFMENPDAKMVADYDTWKKFGRQVKRGEKSISYISDGEVQHCFEISQTTGEKEPFQWRLDKYTAEKFKAMFTAEHNGNFSSVAQCVSFAAVDEVNGSINSIVENLHISKKDHAVFLKSVRSMVRQIMVSRCEYHGAYKINTASLDLFAVDMLHSKAEFEKLCEWVQLTAKSALRKMEITINKIISERSFENERNGQIIGNNRGERENVQARSENADILGGADGELQRGGAGAAESTDRGVRTGMAEVYGGELPIRDSSVGDESAVRADRAESGSGSGGDVQHADGELGSGASSSDNVHGDRGLGENEDNGVQTASDGGRGSKAARDLNENADTLYHNSAEERSSAASYEVVIEYNGDYVFVADRFTQEELSVDYAGEYEGYLKSITEKYPEYAPYINANYDELLKNLHSAHNMAAEEARQVERARLVADMVGGGYGDDEANARAWKRIAELAEFDNRTAENKSITAYRVGDFYEFFNEDALTTAQAINLTQTSRNGVPMTGVPAHAFEKYKNELADKGIAVEIGNEKDIVNIITGTNKTEDDQLSLFDIEPQTESGNADTYITENLSAENAKAALIDYAEIRISYYDGVVREAFLSGDRESFNDNVRKTVDRTISEVLSGELSIEGNFSELYREMYENPEFAETLYTEISEKLYAAHVEIDKARQAAHKVGLPFDEYPYDPEEDFDPYAYNPNRMSDEDYDLMHELIEKDRAKMQVAIESTDDFSDGSFHSELTNIDVQNTDGSYGETKEYYRIVTIGENGLLEAYDNAVFENRDEAKKAITDKGLTEISYDDIVNKALERKRERNINITEKAQTFPTITCEWSESSVFENGKIYSIAEFDRIMKQADDEHIAGEKAALEKYGSHKSWYNAEDDEFSKFLGYDKVKFTLNMPDGTTYTERQDIGDGYGGVIEFLSQYPKYNDIVPILEQAKNRHNFERAKALINDFCEREYKSEGDFSDITRIGLAYTDDEETELPIEVYADLEKLRIVTEFNKIIVAVDQYNSLDEMCDLALDRLDFDDLVYLTEEQRIKGIEKTFATTQVAIESTDDFTDSDFHAETVNINVQNPDGSFGTNKEFYRLVTVTEDGMIEPYDGVIFESREDARNAILQNAQLTEVSYDEIYDKSFENLGRALRQSTKATREPTLKEIEVKIISSDNEILLTFLDEYYPNNNPPFALTNELFKYLDRKVNIEDYGAYDTTKFELMVRGLDNGKDYKYSGIFDIGVDRTRGIVHSLVDNIADFNEYVLEKTNFFSNKDIIQSRQALEVLVPFLKRNCVLSVKEQNILNEFKVRYPIIPDENIIPISENFRIEEIEQTSFGQKSRYAANVAAIRTLNQIESENRIATPDEQKILARYVGWGGIPQAFDSENTAWAKEYVELKELLAPNEYEAARGSVLNAHYTSPTVINAMYKALENMGFKAGNVLEPAMGAGNFFGCMPDSLRDKTSLYGVELDVITGRIAQQLYPKANVQVKGFEKTDFPDNFFDVAVGNVPFGSYGVADNRYDKEKFLIHDYFFAKTLDKVAPGGIVAFVTSKGTLDKVNTKAREYLAKRADLVGAIRLPNNAFKANANTEVTSDIIFLQKREKMAVELPDWVYTAQNSDGITVNQYFLDHPEMILGTMSEDGKLYSGANTTCVPFEGADLKEQLDRAVANLKASIAVKKIAAEKQKTRGEIPATADVRNFTHTIVDGKMYFRENNIMLEVEEKGVTLKRMKALHELRNALRTLIAAQENQCSDELLQAYQGTLNEQYDVFVKKFGNINSRANSSAFSSDDDYNILCALENYDPETKVYSKSDIFTKRTIKAVAEITSVDTPQEALQASLDLKGHVDVIYMSQLCGETPEKVTETLIDAGMIFKNPEKNDDEDQYYGYEESSEYLSGNVREKLRAARNAAEENPDFQRNLTALEGVLPEKITAAEITARIGVNWVDIDDYKQFMLEYAQADRYAMNTLHRTFTGEYKIEGKRTNKGVAATSSFGTSRMTSIEIFERLLNNRDVIVKDRHEDSDGKVYYTVNTKETQLAQNKARAMKEAFARWLWDDPARREKYETRYNELFNSLVGREYDGSHQTFPGMSPFIKLNPHQLNAVQRAKLGGNTLLAHCVGAGKSFEMIAATMEKKRLGLLNKACVVVPKPLVRQMANEWLRLYPDAKILVAGENDFSENNRQKFIGRCCTGDYAAVIMSQQQFEKIPMSLEYRMDFVQRELEMINYGIAEGKASGSRGTVKELERTKKNIEAKIAKLLNAKSKDEALTFEQLGFDSLVVDEAHGYKNGLVVTKMTNVAGVQTRAAQKSEDILMKTQYLNEQSDCKNIIFATGTPISNSMVEMYTMQRYLRSDLLQSAGLENFDDWASTFGEVVTQLEQTPDGQSYRPKKRFAKFANLPELMMMYKEFADIRTPEMIKLPVPDIKGGKAETILAKPSEFQEAYVQQLAERSELIHIGSVDPHDDNMLKITHEARLLGLDARCINLDAENDPNSKVNLCIDKIMDIYNRTSEQKGVQAVFCDVAVNETNGDGEPAFSVYKYIREELARRGISPEEICAANDAKTDVQRTEMMSQLNSGAKRIVLASTSKMGTGANFQQKLCALHHLDIPWKPSDLEQRNGRILRQGNENKEVEIYHYLTEKTFDSYMMSIIVNKQKFISQIMSGKTPARTCQDVDEMVLNYSEMQAIASGDPRIKEKIELDGDVARLRMLESEFKSSKFSMEANVARYEKEIKRITEIAIPKCKSDIEFAKNNELPPDKFEIQICGKIYTERKEAGTALRKQMIEVLKERQTKEVGEYRGFKFSLSLDVGYSPKITLHRDGGLSYYGDTNMDTDIGNILRLENMVGDGMEKHLKHLDGELEYAKENLDAAQKNLATPFEHAAELAEKSARLEQLDRELNIDKADEVIIDNDEEDHNEEQDRGDDLTPKKPKSPKR